MHKIVPLPILVAKPLLEELITDHWNEVATNKDVIKLDPDWDAYAKLEEMNMLLTLCLFVNDVLVGYSIFIINRALHYRTTAVAFNDVIYLTPKYRQGLGGYGIRLIHAAEKHLKSMSVDKITYHIKLDHNWAPVLERIGYVAEEVMMGKLIKKES